MEEQTKEDCWYDEFCWGMKALVLWTPLNEELCLDFAMN